MRPSERFRRASTVPNAPCTPVLLIKDNQKSNFIYRITVRTSGTVPGERTVGQLRLTVRLAVGSQRTAFRTGRDLFIGNHDVSTAWWYNAFYVTGPATSFRTFDPTLQAPGVQTAYTEGFGEWLPGPARTRNQGRVHKGQSGCGNSEMYRDTCEKQDL